MGFLVSPGVHVREIDLTNVIPAVSTSIGAIAGPFAKGPVSSVTAINSEELALINPSYISQRPRHSGLKTFKIEDEIGLTIHSIDYCINLLKNSIVTT